MRRLTAVVTSHQPDLSVAALGVAAVRLSVRPSVLPHLTARRHCVALVDNQFILYRSSTSKLYHAADAQILDPQAEIP